MAIFYFAQRASKLRYYGDVIHSFDWKSGVEVFLALDIPRFVMYCVNGKLRSSLFIESTDSMICMSPYATGHAHLKLLLRSYTYRILQDYYVL